MRVGRLSSRVMTRLLPPLLRLPFSLHLFFLAPTSSDSHASSPFPLHASPRKSANRVRRRGEEEGRRLGNPATSRLRALRTSTTASSPLLSFIPHLFSSFSLLFRHRVSIESLYPSFTDRLFQKRLKRAKHWQQSASTVPQPPGALPAVPGLTRSLQRLDYEDESQRGGYRLGVRVSDGAHEASTRFVVRLLEKNDEPPRIHGPSELRPREDASIGTVLASFRVTDRDNSDSHT